MDSTARPQCDIRGVDMTLYYNMGDDTTPVWVEHLGITGDLTMGETEDEDELSVRDRTRSVKEYTHGETDVAISGTQVLDPLYQGWQVLYSARTHGEPKDIMVLTNPLDVVGAAGWRGKMWNKDRTFNAPGTGPANQAFNLRPAACTDVPVRNVRVEDANTAIDWDPTIVDPVETSASV